jgi:hypothetical protein
VYFGRVQVVQLAISGLILNRDEVKTMCTELAKNMSKSFVNMTAFVRHTDIRPCDARVLLGFARRSDPSFTSVEEIESRGVVYMTFKSYYEEAEKTILAAMLKGQQDEE